MDGQLCPSLRLSAGAAAVALALAPAAQSQVLEIGPDGVNTISGPSIVTSEGAKPIALPKAPAKPVARPSAVKKAAAEPLLDHAGAAVDLSPRLLEAIAYVESRFNTKAVSPKGAVGMMQLMPATAAELGVDPHDPAQNAHGGADYLRRMLKRFDNNVELAVAAYNAGPGAVVKHGGVPPYPETRAYVDAVMDYLAGTSIPETE